MKFLTLLLRNVGRNKIRTVLTALAVVVLVAIYTLASAVTDTINHLVGSHASQSRLMVLEKWVVPSQFPIRYVPKIADVDGVADWTVWHFYAGLLDDAGTRGAGIATRMENLREMHPGLEELDPRLIKAMQRERTGALVGQRILDQMNWQVGQRFRVMSFTHLNKDLEFKIVGTLPGDVWAHNFFFRDDYYQEACDDKDNVAIMWLQVADEQNGKRVAAEVEQMFANSPAKVRVETESAGVARFAGRTNTIVSIINFVVAVLLIDMVIVLANSINMTVRERRSEMAIFKILGFQPSFILAMVIGEAVLIGALGGIIGAGTTYGISLLNAADQLPVRMSFLLQFPIPAKFLLHGLVVGASVGLIGSAIPAAHAQRVGVAEAFSRVG